MTAPRTLRAIGRTLREVGHDLRAGRLLEHQPHHVDLCPCCEGDPRLQRCDVRLGRGPVEAGR